MWIMKRIANTSLTKTTWNEVSKKSAYFSSDKINKLNVKDRVMEQLFSNDQLVDVLKELAKV